MDNNLEHAKNLRKVAQELRETASELEDLRMQKCAQTLIAARGLLQLSNIIQGVDDASY